MRNIVSCINILEHKKTKIVHWMILRGKYGLERAAWYDHPTNGVVESDEVKVLWDFMLQYGHHIECRKPDIAVVEKEERKCLIIDIVIPDYNNVGVKEKEKIQNYDDLKREIK